MIKKYLFVLSLLTYGMVQAQTDRYRIVINLNETSEDEVPVTVYPPASDSAFSEYHMAKVVPGTYDISDFGRFVTDFTAYDSQGDTLAVEQISVNRWKIENNGKLNKITYRVNDSWDAFEGYGENIIFEPGGTNIDKEDQVYVINTFGFVGYVDGMKFHPYEVEIKHPEGIYGATALERKSSNDSVDVFTAEDFNFLADGPIMYSEPDTASRQIANAKVIVSVYSPNSLLSANDVMENLDDLMKAQAKYLGGQLPVDRYAYLIFLNDEPTLSGSMGALEHSYSSVYSLPEASADLIGQTVRDVAAHEFFHIVTPLNIHAEEIGNFDYIDPEMSEHLWLYEGVTEYSSMHVQVKYGLYGPEKFLDEVQQKLEVAEQYPDDVAFTEMSENILEPDYAKMYVNVYYKGALIGMALDLHILKYSNGEKDLQWLMRELAKKYGKEVSFKDEELFDVIEDLTYPEVGEFLRRHVGGTEPLPIEEVLSWAGVTYQEEKQTKEITMGGIGLTLNAEQEIVISDLSESNEFAEDLKLQEGDVIVSFNGKPFSLATAQDVMTEYKATAEPGDKVTMRVKREKKNGKVKEKKLKAKAMLVDSTRRHMLEFEENPTEEQMRIRKAWLQADDM